jgi:hypothetical protein
VNLTIENSETSLSASGWMLQEPSLRKRINIQQRFGKSGGTVSGDRESASRNTSIETDITAENDTDYIQRLGDIVRIFDKNKSPYYLNDTDNNRRIKIELDLI